MINFLKRNLSQLILLTLLVSPLIRAADVIDTIEEEDRSERTTTTGNSAPQLFNESIRAISPSKKIFIITNANQSFSRGDYVSILLNNQLVCRALVAKTTDSQIGGIKIVKIYNNNLWSQLARNKEVLILKGDDSYYNTQNKVASDDSSKDKKGKKGKDDLKINSEDDLFNSTTVEPEDDLSLDENNKRLIKPDNLLGMNYSLLQSLDNTQSSTRYGHFNANWAYQMTDNVWGELGVGTNTITDYPDVTGLGGIDTRLISINLRLKYTISAPFYSYIQPYAGYQMVMAQSPGAGQVDANASTQPTQAQLNEELARVDALKKSGPIFGVTILRRIVPGWFARFDLGSDLIGGGLTLEF